MQNDLDQKLPVRRLSEVLLAVVGQVCDDGRDALHLLQNVGVFTHVRSEDGPDDQLPDVSLFVRCEGGEDVQFGPPSESLEEERGVVVLQHAHVVVQHRSRRFRIDLKVVVPARVVDVVAKGGHFQSEDVERRQRCNASLRLCQCDKAAVHHGDAVLKVVVRILRVVVFGDHFDEALQLARGHVVVHKRAVVREHGHDGVHDAGLVRGEQVPIVI
mmetsp:Transcript_19464/g.67101  ORF Transcript_19464/g.67101 Transcript_19464/m.67101 type:complete len:215 (+) Transcript_19464:995-1639(+)